MKESIKHLKSYEPETSVEKVKAEYHLDRIVRLSANENPYGTSPKVKEAILNWDFDGNYYPDSESKILRNQIANYWSLSPDQLIFGVGLDEILELISRTFLTPDDEVVVPNPTFSEYVLHAEIEGAKVVKVPIDAGTGHYDWSSMTKSVTRQTKLVWLCNPNNPTGVIESRADIQAFLDQVPSYTLVLVDEAYMDFADEAQGVTCFPLLSQYPNLAVLRTFSKAYGLAGFRVGFIAMAPQLAQYMQMIRLPYNIPTVSQIAAQAAFSDQVFVDQVVAKNRVERQRWMDFFDQMGVKYFPSQTNFIYYRVEDEQCLAEALLSQGYQIRRGFQPHWLRNTIGQTADNDQIMAITREFLKA